MLDYIFKGVYSLKLADPPGGAHKTYYCVWQRRDGFVVRTLDLKSRSISDPAFVRKNDFGSLFTIEPSIKYVPGKEEQKAFAGKRISDFYAPEGNFGPPLESGKQQTAAGTEGAGKTRETSAAEELVKSLRSQFADGLAAVKEPRKRNAAMSLLQNVIEHEEGIEPGHKHMFCDFGIALRKARLLPLSLQCCLKVIKLAPVDENAYFNAARVCYDSGKIDEAKQYLAEALKLEPNLVYASQFLDFIQNNRGKGKRTAV